MNIRQHIQWFRNAAPYINAFRGKIFVLMLPGETVKLERFTSLIHDIALCHHLGIKPVIVHGAREQIDELLDQKGVHSQFHQGVRVTEPSIMPLVIRAIGEVKHTIEARLSMGLPNTPMQGAEISVISGNFVSGMPLGIIDGTDMQYSGKVRSINTCAINAMLEKHVVLVSNLGFSKSGEIFNLPAEELATQIAIELKAEKLIFLSDEYIQSDSSDQFSSQQCRDYLAANEVSATFSSLLRHSIEAVEQRVDRVHIIDHHIDGGLLQELFTREAAGMMITNRFYEGLRPAQIDDLGGILELINPLEDEGILVKRSREQLELEINHFFVIEKDRLIIGCLACIPDHSSHMAEIACVAIHPDFQNQGLGQQLLDAAENRAQQLQMKSLYILTTKTSHWFLENGFTESSVENLPELKKQEYNTDRASLVMVKSLEKI